jgi:mannose-6-phosphate isomerase-like protein (cupin superfamily)
MMVALAAPPAAASGCPTAPAGDNPHGSRIVHESQLPCEQPGPHEGGGDTTAYPFFADAPGLGFVFRKRVLHPGAAIGAHLHVHDEVYYVISGRGRYTLDGEEHDVGPGNAMLTRRGSTHALRQVGGEDLVILIAYPQDPAPAAASR